MERKCKNCVWFDGIDVCELDNEHVNRFTSCDYFEEDDSENFVKTSKKKERYQ